MTRNELVEFTQGDEDPLGFTRQTAMLLSGMGGDQLVPQFKKRNISTDAMANLTEEDLRLLGADEKLAQNMLRQMQVITRNSSRHTITDQQRLEQLIEILRLGEQQLSLIQVFIAYARLRLKGDIINSFIEPDKNLQASQALQMAVTATLVEVDEAEAALQELGEYFAGEEKRPKHTKIFLCTLAGIAVIAFTVVRKYR